MIGRDKKSTGGQQNFRDHTLIAPSARIVGDIEFNGGLHVQGEVDGNITVGEDGGQLVIGESGVVRGAVAYTQLTLTTNRRG